jgi:N-methylhydantoinase A
MAGEIRLMTLDQGLDPRDFTLVIFGGAGPLHGAAIAREMGLRQILVPRHPGVLCALGCAVADVRYDFGQTLERTLPHTPEAATALEATLGDVFAGQRELGERQLERDAIATEGVRVQHLLEMSYVGQVHRIRVAVGSSDGFDWSIEQVAAAFATAYEQEYGVTLPENDVMIVNASTVVVGIRPRRRDAAAASDGRDGGGGAPQPVRHRSVCFEEWTQTPVYDRADLRPGTRLSGPAIVQQPDTTVLVEPRMDVLVDRHHNLLVSVR